MDFYNGQQWSIVNNGLLPDETEITHFKKYESISAELVSDAVLKTRVGSAPSGVDADGWRRILLASKFWERSTDLRKTVVNLIKNTYQK